MDILYRKKVVVNTDPQRRCYNGCHASSEEVWTPWEVLEYAIPEESVEDRLESWRDLNAFAVSQRGSSAKTEFKAVATDGSE